MNDKMQIIEGQVTRALGQTVYIRFKNESNEKICYIRRNLKRDRSVLNPVAVGDYVKIQFKKEDERGFVTEVLPRKNKLSRQASKELGFREHTLAANLDQIIVVFAAHQPEPSINKIDRLMVITEACEIPVVLCMNKMDLATNETEKLIKVYENVGYRCLRNSALTGENIDKLKQLLTNKLSILIGFSGVGKSTILNKIEPGLSLRVQEIASKTGKGKHTTTAAQMFDLSFGGAIVDTAGLKALSIWGVDQVGLSLCYPEIVPYLDDCYFDNCLHITEPNCAVKAALKTGKINPHRYESYCRILKSL